MTRAVSRSETYRIEYYSCPNYWERVETIFHDPEELLEHLDYLAGEQYSSIGGPCFLEIQRPEGDKIALGITKRQWLLMQMRGPFDCLYSVGNKQASGGVSFYPTETRMSRKHLISKSKARKVLHHWLDSGKLSNDIAWADYFFDD